MKTTEVQIPDGKTACGGWIARDEDGELWIYFDCKPTRGSKQWATDGTKFRRIGGADLFPCVRWEDEEPTEVTITIKPKSNENNPG